MEFKIRSHTDDTVLLAQTEDNLQKLLYTFKLTDAKYKR
jgi:hypothetical protein